MVISDRGIVATSQTLASQAGAQVLARGGSAMDAAIAANATLGVVEPESCGIGGDLFAIYWDAKTGKLTAINASGWAPKGADHRLAEEARANRHAAGRHPLGDRPRLRGRLVEAPQALRQAALEGCLPARHLLRRARLPRHRDDRRGMERRKRPNSSKDAERAQGFPAERRGPAVGEVFRNPQMAAALRLIAQEGRAGLLSRRDRQSHPPNQRRLGGKMTAADLSEFEAEWVEPISTDYRGWKVYELPPNGQGIAALEMLNIMSLFPLSTYAAARRDRTAHADRSAEAGVRRPAPLRRRSAVQQSARRGHDVDGVCAGARQADRSRIRRAATCSTGQPASIHGDTIYLSVVDREGNIVSLIQSLYQHFGSGVVVDDYGFALQNRGGLFELDPEHPNALAPRKRPFHTIIPAFMEKGDVHIGFGIMGGLNQAQAHAQFVSNMVDHGMNIQMALEAPRFTKLDLGRLRSARSRAASRAKSAMRSPRRATS